MTARKRVRRTAPAEPVLPPGACPLPPAKDEGDALVAAPPSVPVDGLRLRELGGFPAHLLAELPAAVTLLLRTAGGRPCAVTTSRADWVAARQRPQCAAFAGDEWAAMVLAVQQDRAAPEVLDAWCGRKCGEPNWELTPGAALAGLAALERTARRPTVGQVLRAYGAQLRAVPDGRATEVDWAVLYRSGGDGYGKHE